jgi:HD-GYP domain-containing protein (c-di-GMP phosphodiesterase class II)
MRLQVRTFLWFFVPLTVLLTATFSAVERTVVAVVRGALRSSLREHQIAIARMQARNAQQNRRYLKIVAENAALKAGLQLMLAEPKSAAARLTVEDQLRELGSAAAIDLLIVSTVDGAPLAGVLREGGAVVPIDAAALRPPSRGLFPYGKSIYQITSIPVDSNDETVALLSVGEREDLKDLNTPLILLRDGKVVASSFSGLAPAQLEPALANCRQDAECEITLGAGTFLSLGTRTAELGPGYTLRSMVNIDAALKPVQSILRNVFVVAAAAAILAATLMAALSTISVVKPIAQIVAHLRQSERTGKLIEFDAGRATVREIRELTEVFNRAAASIREGEKQLHRAYVEFVGSLASALDARDPYTAGHSGRVCEFSSAIAQAMNLGPEELDCLRIGALLHDIGKIGIADAILRKPGRLTDEEFALIKLHPQIGRHILDGVDGFSPYLSIVELHHENWDGTGYPHGLREEDIPLAARIVHVADAYDAMTSDRPYRAGMTPDVALGILEENAGSQFDAAVVAVFANLWKAGAVAGIHSRSGPEQSESLRRMANVLAGREVAAGGGLS